MAHPAPSAHGNPKEQPGCVPHAWHGSLTELHQSHNKLRRRGSAATTTACSPPGHGRLSLLSCFCLPGVSNAWARLPLWRHGHAVCTSEVYMSLRRRRRRLRRGGTIVLQISSLPLCAQSHSLRRVAPDAEVIVAAAVTLSSTGHSARNGWRGNAPK